MRLENKTTIERIRDFFQSRGFECKKEHPSIYNSDNPNKSSVNKSDICCWKKIPKIMRCFEVEDSQRQVVKNFRAGKQYEKEMQGKGFNSKFCQLVSGENFREVC